MTLRPKTCIPAILFLLIAASPLSRAQNDAKRSNEGLQNLLEAHQPLDPNRLNDALLVQTLVHFTNRARLNHHLDPCTPDEKLRNAARSHSEEMVRLRYFSHESPVKKNHHLMDRLKNAGLSLGNTMMGENIGMDYFLRIARVPFYKRNSSDGKTRYINAKTGKPIEYQTYWEFARQMIDNWMKSPDHRKNILNKQFKRIGIGIARGTFQGFKSIYVTQNFIGPIKLKIHPDQPN